VSFTLFCLESDLIFQTLICGRSVPVVGTQVEFLVQCVQIAYLAYLRLVQSDVDALDSRWSVLRATDTMSVLSDVGVDLQRKGSLLRTSVDGNEIKSTQTRVVARTRPGGDNSSLGLAGDVSVVEVVDVVNV